MKLGTDKQTNIQTDKVKSQSCDLLKFIYYRLALDSNLVEVRWATLFFLALVLMTVLQCQFVMKEKRGTCNKNGLRNLMNYRLTDRKFINMALSFSEVSLCACMCACACVLQHAKTRCSASRQSWICGHTLKMFIWVSDRISRQNYRVFDQWCDWRQM